MQQAAKGAPATDQSETCKKPIERPLMCSKCKSAFYCNADCQREDRKGHQQLCNSLALLRESQKLERLNVRKAGVAKMPTPDLRDAAFAIAAPRTHLLVENDDVTDGEAHAFSLFYAFVPHRGVKKDMIGEHKTWKEAWAAEVNRKGDELRVGLSYTAGADFNDQNMTMRPIEVPMRTAMRITDPELLARYESNGRRCHRCAKVCAGEKTGGDGGECRKCKEAFFCSVACAQLSWWHSCSFELSQR